MKNNTPDYRTKQRLLYGEKLNREQLVKAASGLKEAGNLCEALELYHRAGEMEAISSLLQTIRGEGDLFLFEKTMQLLEKEPTTEDYRAVGEAALKSGKLNFAFTAFTKAGDAGKASEIDTLRNKVDKKDVSEEESQEQVEEQRQTA